MSELQHPGARSFEDVADLYERVRPSYPEEAVDWLAERLRIDARSTVLDLGAGTGKLTRAFVRRAAHVIAVEPGPEMLAQLRRVVPHADAVVATTFRRDAVPELEAELSAAITRIQEGVFRPTPSEFVCAGCPALDVVCAGPRLREGGYAEAALVSVS